MSGVSLGKRGEQSKGLEARENRETGGEFPAALLSGSRDWSDRSLLTTCSDDPHFILRGSRRPLWEGLGDFRTMLVNCVLE